jgi:hypothetical protein
MKPSPNVFIVNKALRKRRHPEARAFREPKDLNVNFKHTFPVRP